MRSPRARFVSPDKRPHMHSPLPQQRSQLLLNRQQQKMASSSHAYVRGSTLSFYNWLEEAKARVPHGPDVWICGDCHLGNLGPVADTKQRVAVQIRDLDQTVIGNPAHDLVRLGLSLTSVARGSNLPGAAMLVMLEAMLEGYGRGLIHPGTAHIVPAPKEIRQILNQSVRRRWRHLAEERLEDVRPTIPLGKRFWALSAVERNAMSSLFDSSAVRNLLTSLKARDDNAPVELLDVAYWVKGCSSLGRLRFAALASVGTDICLIDIKQATPAAAPRAAGAIMPTDHAERVVAGAVALAPNLGRRMLAARLLDKPVVVRELMPQDLKLDIEHLAQTEAFEIAGYLASVVGQAHGRQLSTADRTQWLRAVRPKRSGKTPTWLWSAIVELLALHEAAYLDHCWKVARAS
ncbi:MAG: DUF2252 family protein [Acidobacteriaceae bacterium]|nr:DUF2252 family protein [Acidobacteriaceae bacterium]